VVSVTPNDPIVFSEGAPSASPSVPAPASVYGRELGADTVHRYGADGANATVALVDTGVARVPDLAGRIVAVPDPHTASPPGPGEAPPLVGCADFSGDTAFGTAPTCRDGYGHGTFMAGIIAGDGAASAGRYRGVAPAARIADIKIAGDNGAADVSKVLAAIQYAVSFKDVIQPPVRVLNLSLGTTSRKDYRHDPLNYAVERAWASGLVVVVAAGNTGPGRSTVTKPADDPLVLTVGAVDDVETASADDDRLPNFSARGPATFDDYGDPPAPATAGDGTALEVAKPDVVAPGGRLVSLRPVDANGNPTPTAVPPPASGSWSDNHYRRGSGTSMATAAVSGVAALYADAKARLGAEWTANDPQRFKRAVVRTARPVAGGPSIAVGRGLVDAFGGIRAAILDGPVAPAVPEAAGDGSLAASRGAASQTVRDCTDRERLLRLTPFGPCTVTIDGERTAQNQMWMAERYRGEWTGSSWYGSSWYGSSWYGSSWYGSSWYGSSWYGSSWYGSTDDRSYGAATNGSSWYGGWE
jgi:serine protease AprX